MANFQSISRKTIQGNEVALNFHDNGDGTLTMTVDPNPPKGYPSDPASIPSASPIKVLAAITPSNEIVGLLVPANLVAVDDIAQLIRFVQAQGIFLFNSPDDGVGCDVQFENNGKLHDLLTTNTAGVVSSVFRDSASELIWQADDGGIMNMPLPRQGQVFGPQANISDRPAGAVIDTTHSISTIIAQTTAGQTMTLGDPQIVTDSNYYQVGNSGSVSFLVDGIAIAPGRCVMFLWDTGSLAWFAPPIPTTAVPGSSGDLIWNSGGDFAATTQITTDGISLFFTANSLLRGVTFISNATTPDGMEFVNANAQPTQFEFPGGGVFEIKDEGGVVIVLFDSVTGNFQLKKSLTLSGDAPITDKPAGGSIGSAATTVDIACSATVNQTTAGQTLTVPNPTDSTFGRIFYLHNVGSTSFTYGTTVIAPGFGIQLQWTGAAWSQIL